MKTTIRATFLVLVIATAMMSAGCSALSYNSSVDEIQRERVYASGNRDAIRTLNTTGNEEAAIHAVALGPQAVGIGVDVSAWEAIAKHPIRQLLAAAVDVGAAYGAYLGVKEISESSGDDSDDNGNGGNTSGGDTIVIDGNGNTVNTGDTGDVGEGRVGEPVVVPN